MRHVRFDFLKDPYRSHQMFGGDQTRRDERHVDIMSGLSLDFQPFYVIFPLICLTDAFSVFLSFCLDFENSEKTGLGVIQVSIGAF